MEITLPKIAVQTELDDYKKDGLIYCGKCHTPKQCIVTILGKTQKQPCLCVCGLKKRENDRFVLKEKERLQRVTDMRKQSFSNSCMEHWRFDATDTKNTKVVKQAMSYVKNFDEFYKRGKGIAFCGTVGTGKTFVACCIANAMIDMGKSVLFTNFCDISNQLFNCINKDEYMEQFKKVTLLVLDDFSMERNTQYMNEIVYNVIDVRYRSGKPMIITTNLSMNALKNPETLEKQRVFSRLLEICIPVKVNGEDMRREKGLSEYNNDLNILNGGL